MDGLPSIHFSSTRDWRREVWKRSVCEEKTLLHLELWLVSDLLILLSWFFFYIIHQELFPNRLLPSPPCVCSSPLLFCPLLLCKKPRGPGVSLRSSLSCHPGFEDELRREKKMAGSSTRLDGFPPGQQAPAGTGCCRTLHRHPTQRQVVCATTITTKTN